MGAEAPIARVTVHTNGALVTRRLVAEPGDVTVSGLPLVFSSDSLRVRANAGQVLDVEETCALESEPAPPPPDEEKLEALAREDARLRDRLRTLQAMVRAWQGAVPGEPGEEPPEGVPDAETWLSAHARSDDELRALEDEVAVLEKERRRVAREKRRAERTAKGDRAPPRFSRGVSFRLEGEAKTAVEVEYFVSGARWAPSYTLELDAGSGRLTTHALVAQATGEDWSSAELLFSTADLTRESTLPELASWRIGRAQPARRPAFRPLPDDLGQLFAGYDHDLRPGDARGPGAPLPPTPKSPIREMIEEAVREEDWEDEPTSETAMMLDESDEGLDSFADDEMPDGGPPAAAPAAMMTEMAAAPPMASRSAEAPRLMNKRAAPGGGGFGGRAEPTAFVAPPEPLPPRLRYAYLRVAGPQEAGRGQLNAVDPLEHLHSLIQDHEAADLGELARAVAALHNAQSRVEHRSPPGRAHVVAAGHFHHVFRADGAHDVPTDGSWHRVVVEQREAEARVDFRCVPREADDVFRFCTLATPAGAPLLPGPLNVYEDGAFRVTSRVDGSGAGERLELNLGVETAVRVTGRTANIHQAEKGLVSQTSRVTHEVTVGLRSALPDAARVIVFDRLPVVDEDQKDVEVKLASADPTPVRDDKDPRGRPLAGGLRFELDLPPGEKRDVRFAYEITLPAKAEIVGGNRRE